MALFPGKVLVEDVDLALLPRKDQLGWSREKNYEALQTERVDLVNLKTASPLLRFEIIRTGLLINEESGHKENEFEHAALSEQRHAMYLRKKQARILEQRPQRWS
ncbi:MAG: hypothetical protein JRJ12_01095 [Deltaproteobacteria bacterium]|nr:hypothetical protein [Deltaproteobacteria bacterium]MBW2070065.1 hypothetical protein [Deltaproteobacteria bacterium]